MDCISVDWVRVVVAAVLNMVINFVWYSRWLFGKEWVSLSKVKMEDMKGMRGAIAWSLIISLMTAYLLSWFMMQIGTTTVVDGMFVGFIAWLAFVATTQSNSVIWCKKPFALFLIETGNRLVALLVMGGVLGT